MVTHKFFKLLSEYSKGKVLTIQTNRMLKAKRPKKHNIEDEEDEKELADFISEDSDAENNENMDESYQ